METYVSEMIDADSIRWIPLYRAMALKDTKDSNNDLEKQMEDLIARIDRVKDKIGGAK